MQFTAALLALAASASAHMVLDYPVPYGNPNNSPLDNSGSDFPCKATGPESYTVTTPNEWNAGETKTIKFKGSAVHGGGSCQFSITTDKAPTKDTQWKVIHSVIGGCPSDADGNLPSDPDGNGAATFPVTLPADLPSGEYSFAWTWFNKIGNREMYMNCAPITVGGSQSQASTAEVSSVLGSLPDMFVANLPREQCATDDTKDLEFPNPGEGAVIGAKAIPGSVQGSGCAAMTGLGAGNGQMGSPSQATGAPVATEPAATQPAATTPVASATAVPSNPGGVFAPGASSAAASSPVAAPTAAPVPAPSQPANSTPSNGGTPCTTDGAIVCIGSNQFGLCNMGVAVAMDLAAGTTCSNGVISRRSIHFPRAHLHKRHGSSLL